MLNERLRGWDGDFGHDVIKNGVLHRESAGTDQFTAPGPQQVVENTDVIPGSTATTYTLAIGASETGVINSVGDHDWFKVDLVAGQSYVFTMTGAQDAYLELYNPGGGLVSFDDDGSTTLGSLNSVMRFTSLSTQTYYLNARAYEATGVSNTGAYTVTAAIGPPQNPLDTINLGYTAPLHIDVYFATQGQTWQGETALRNWAQAEIDAAMAALGTYAAVSPLTFTRTMSSAGAEFILTLANLEENVLGQMGTTGGVGYGAFSPTVASWTAVGALLPGGAAFTTLLHEFGHGLGLAHPHDNGGVSEVMQGVIDPFGWTGTFQLNQGVFTVMSYNDGWRTGPLGPTPSDSYGASGTPGALDIGLIQQRYGVNLATNTGDTSYLVGNVNGAYRTIWDAGGTDTLTINNANGGTIDLRAATLQNDGGGGYVSFVNGVHGGFTIANGVIIENATGAGGNDFLTGNNANNILIGNGGNDFFVGGAGNDFFDGGQGNDIAQYTGTLESRSFLSYNGVTAVINVGANETDQARNIENFQFTNGSMNINFVATFNPVEYLATWGDLLTGYGANNNALVFQHYILHGAFEGRVLDGFNNYLYLASNPDLLATLGADANAAALQYVQSGFAAHRPTSGFNALEYIASNPDLIAGLHSNATAGLAHYVEHGFAEHRATTSFDPYQYIASYPDLIAGFHGNAAGGLQHYLDHGFDEGRAADTFDALRYLASNLDLLGGFGHDETAAARHYVQHGFDKGRSLTSFDPYQYIASYADLITSIGANADAATLHFVDVGFGQGRARDTFDAAQYLANYADLQAAFGTDLFAATLHYIQSGYFEGRTDDPIGP